MAEINLSDYDFGELKGLLFEVEKELKVRRKRQVQEARQRIAGIAEGAGLPLDGLLDGADAAGAAARYRNPADGAQTWSGRGRQPKWIAEALAAGRSLDEFRDADAG